VTDDHASRQLSRRRFIAAASGASLAVNRRNSRSFANAGVFAQSTGRDWPLFGADLAGTRVAPATVISSANVDSLRQIWNVDAGAPIDGTAVIAGGIAYLGAYNGTLNALDLATGATVWTYDTGAAVREPNLDVELGILGSAAVAGDTVFIGDATATVHAVDPATGALRWKTKADDQNAAGIWSSPVAANGAVYIGVASVAKETGFRGSVVALDAASGLQRWKTYSVPSESDGGGVLAVPALDLDRGLLYVGTDRAFSPNPIPYGNPMSVLALDLETGDERWAFNAPPGGGPTAPTGDVGFAASPNLFSATLFGQRRDFVGIGQKSGMYWALDRDTGEMVWRTQVAPAGPLGGVVGTSAVGAHGLVIPATNWPDPAGSAAGVIAGLDPAIGKILWSVDLAAPALAPVTICNDVALHAGLDGVMRALDLMSGQEFWQFDLGASVSGGITVADDTIVLTAAAPPLAPFIRTGTSVIAFSLGSESPVAPPTITPIGDGTGG
jgi:polyvinyl alcohol dehydrogenase (cytochrome)